MSIHFSSGRKVFTDDVWCFTIDPTQGDLSAGNYYFTIQGRNRIGLNKPLKSALISVPSDSTLTITLKTNIFATGENWFDYILSISQVDNLNTFKQILAVNLKTNDDVFLPSLPLDIVLNKDADLETEAEYCNANDIDDSEFKNGKIIRCTDTNYLYEFYSNIFLEENEINDNQFNTLNGSYKRVLSSNKNIINVDDYGGCDLDIRADLALLDYFRIPEYQINNTDSEFLKFTIDNNSDIAIPANSLVSISAFINGQNGAGYLQNSLFVIYRGFINLTTGELRTTDDENEPLNYIGVPLTYDSSNPNLFLPDEIKSNEGFIVDLFVNLNPINLSNLFSNNSGLLLYPSVALDYIRYSPFYEIFSEGAIVNKPDYCFLDPQLDGNVVVKKGEFVFKGYSITRNFEEEYILQNNSEQYLNLTPEGVIESYLLNETLPFNSINVGRIKCLAGKSKISNKISITLASTGSLNFSLNLDVLEGKIKVRDNYENLDLRDKRISFPTLNLDIYIKKPDNSIVKLAYVVEELASQDVEILSLPSTLVTEETINSDESFGLIDSPILEATATGLGLVPSGTYEIYCSFIYSGLEITDILDTLKIFDLNNLGGGSSSFNYSISNINSTANLLLNLNTTLNYSITLVGNCTLQNPVSYQVGSTINLMIKQDTTGNRLLTFGDFWKFKDTEVISSFAESISLIRGFVTSTGIYCELVKTYDYTPPENQSGQLNNNQQLNNDLQLTN